MTLYLMHKDKVVEPFLPSQNRITNAGREELISILPAFFHSAGYCFLFSISFMIWFILRSSSGVLYLRIASTIAVVSTAEKLMFSSRLLWASAIKKEMCIRDRRGYAAYL